MTAKKPIVSCSGIPFTLPWFWDKYDGQLCSISLDLYLYRFLHQSNGFTNSRAGKVAAIFSKGFDCKQSISPNIKIKSPL
jgi:hypothetical protein